MLRYLTAIFLATCPIASGQSDIYYWQNFAGLPGGLGNADGPRETARFFSTQDVAVDPEGNIFVAGLVQAVGAPIRKVSPTGVVTTLALSDAGDEAAVFPIASCIEIAFSPDGCLIIGVTNTIRKVTPSGFVSILAGEPNEPETVDGVGSAARLQSVRGITVAGNGDTYFTNNHSVRKVTAAGVVSTVAGNPNVPGSANGTGSSARFNFPRHLAVDGNGNLFVADLLNYLIRKVTPEGVVTTVAGINGIQGSEDGLAASARFANPRGIAVDGDGSIFVADSGFVFREFNHTIRKITSEGIVSTVAGLAGNPGLVDGVGSAARFLRPSAIAFRADGSLIVADSGNVAIRSIDPAGSVDTVAGGNMANPGTTNGAREDARFASPGGVAIGPDGSLFIVDSGNITIRKISPLGTVTTLAGTPGAGGNDDGEGSAASFFGPSGIAVDGGGIIYVSDGSTNTIRRITSSGVVTTLAGEAFAAGTTDGTGGTARFNNPRDLTVAPNGDVYVADQNNFTIRRMTPDGMVTTFAGSAGEFASIDGRGSAARFSRPTGIAADSGGNLYVLDLSSVRKITPDGTVTTLAGKPTERGFADGAGGDARFSFPSGIASDASGNLLVMDSSTIVRQISSDGVVTTVGGTMDIFGGADGIMGQSQFSFGEFSGVAVAQDGTVYLADGGNNRIVRGRPVDVGDYAFGRLPEQDCGQLLIQGAVSGSNFELSFSELDCVSGIRYGAEWSPSLGSGTWLPLTDIGAGGSHLFRFPITDRRSAFTRVTAELE